MQISITMQDLQFLDYQIVDNKKIQVGMTKWLIGERHLPTNLIPQIGSQENTW